MTEKVCVLVIDPQYDFCDIPADLQFIDGKDSSGKIVRIEPALPVAGAHLDMLRASDFILRNKQNIEDIQITLDSHHPVHIAHPISWVDKDGKHPAPFTVISADAVRKGEYRAFNPEFQSQYLNYVETLEKNQRYVLCIWNPHCLIGSVGQTIHPTLFKAVMEWEKQYAVAGMVTKGSNMHTEHYSAVKADVEDHRDVTTKLNEPFMEILKKYDRIIALGEARQFCLANTIYDVVEYFGEAEAKKIVIFDDCTSPIPGMDALNAKFDAFCDNVGIVRMKSTDYKFS